MNKQQKRSKKSIDETPLDAYEQELAAFLDEGKLSGRPDFEDDKKMFEESARRYVELQGSKSITLRLKKKDLIRLRAKAARKNIPYQTLIGLLVNSYAEGKTKLTV